MADETAIRAVIQDYFDALYEGDVAKFGAVFHPACRLFSVAEEQVTTIDYEPYLARVAGRPSPASRNDARQDEIVAVTVSSPTTAHARVRDCYLPKSYVNELTFLKTGGQWRIAAKVFHAWE